VSISTPFSTVLFFHYVIYGVQVFHVELYVMRPPTNGN